MWGSGSFSRSLNSAVGDYNRFTATFESRVLVTGRKLRDLNIETGGRDIEEPEQIETIARDPAAPEAMRALPDIDVLQDAADREAAE